jgi:hypothetical protein
MKQVIVTFNFDPETETVSDVKCSVDGVEKKKTTTKRVKTVVEELASKPLITLEANKLVLNNRLIADMNLAYEDRVVIEWKKIGTSTKMVPTIRKDDELGNKVTKSNTVTYRGSANKVLAELGTEFTIEPLKEGLWQMIPTVSKYDPNMEDITLEDAIIEAENTEAELLTDSDEEQEIDELPYKF